MAVCKGRWVETQDVRGGAAIATSRREFGVQDFSGTSPFLGLLGNFSLSKDMQTRKLWPTRVLSIACFTVVQYLSPLIRCNKPCQQTSPRTFWGACCCMTLCNLHWEGEAKPNFTKVTTDATDEVARTGRLLTTNSFKPTAPAACSFASSTCESILRFLCSSRSWAKSASSSLCFIKYFLLVHLLEFAALWGFSPFSPKRLDGFGGVVMMMSLVLVCLSLSIYIYIYMLWCYYLVQVWGF